MSSKLVDKLINYESNIVNIDKTISTGFTNITTALYLFINKIDLKIYERRKKKKKQHTSFGIRKCWH